MASFNTCRAALMLLGLLLASSSAAAAAPRQLLQAPAAAAAALACPAIPSTVELDFAPVATACENATVCTSCVCSLVTVFTPALLAGNVTFDPASPTSFPLDAAAGIIRACSEQYLVSMVAAGVDLTVLAGLTGCSFDNAATVPACLVDSIAGLVVNTTAANTTNTTAAVDAEVLPTNATVITTDAAGNPTDTMADVVNVTATSRTDMPAAITGTPAPTPAAPAAKSSALSAAASVISTLGAAVLLAATLLA